MPQQNGQRSRAAQQQQLLNKIPNIKREREIIIFKAFLFYVVLMFLLFTQTSVRHLPSIIYHRKRDRAGIIESIICRAEVFEALREAVIRDGKMAK